jgi:hypothetical protein
LYIGLKLLQTLLNVLAQLHARMNATVVLWTVLSIIALLISLFHLRFHLFASIYLIYPSLLELDLFQMILLLNLHKSFIIMDSNIIIFLKP